MISMINRPLILSLVIALGSLALYGCGSQSASEQSSFAQAAEFDRAKFVLNEEPDGAVGVIDAKETVEDGAPVVLVGRVGGSEQPWIEGRAAFTLMDPSMTMVAAGTDSNPDEVCTDDCCAAERLECTTLVKFVDDHGHVIPVDSRELLGLHLNDMVVIKGTAKKDQSGNFSLLASGLYVRK